MRDLARWRDVDPMSIRELSHWAEVVNGIYLEAKAERGGLRYGVPHLQRRIDLRHCERGGRPHNVVLKAAAVTTWRGGTLPSRSQVDTFIAFLWACGVSVDHLDAWQEGVCRMRRMRDKPRRRIAYRLVQPRGLSLATPAGRSPGSEHQRARETARSAAASTPR